MAPSDPILGITEAFHADQNSKKVNLGVGVYTDDSGKVPLLECVRRAESERLKAAPPRNYLPIRNANREPNSSDIPTLGAEIDRACVAVQRSAPPFLPKGAVLHMLDMTGFETGNGI